MTTPSTNPPSCKICNSTKIRAKSYCCRHYEMHHDGMTDDEIRARIADPDYLVRSAGQATKRKTAPTGAPICPGCKKTVTGWKVRAKTEADAKLCPSCLTASYSEQGVRGGAAQKVAARKRRESREVALETASAEIARQKERAKKAAPEKLNQEMLAARMLRGAIVPAFNIIVGGQCG